MKKINLNLPVLEFTNRNALNRVVEWNEWLGASRHKH